MAISSRKAGAVVECPTCGEQTQVPEQDIFTPAAPKQIPQADNEPDVVPATNKPEHAARKSDEPVSNDRNGEELESEEEEWTGPSDLPLDANPELVSETPIPAQSSDPPFSFDKSHDAPKEDQVYDEYDEDEEDEEQRYAPLSIRRRSRGDEEMDLTPMVDVTFQLLIFFMVSASFSLQKSIEVPLPDPDQQGASQQVQIMEDLLGTSIIVKIDDSNTIWIDDEPLADAAQLAETLRDKMRKEQKTELLVTADSQSQHRHVIAVIDAANEVGMQKIRMTSRKKAD